LWKQCQGEERFILWEQTNTALFLSAGLLADGKTVFAAGNEKVVRLWDLDSRREIGELPHSEKVTGAAASPDGRWLATTTGKFDEKQPVLLWNLATRKVAALTTNFSLRSRSIAFSPESQWLAFGTMYDGIRVWDVNARSEITNLPAFQTQIGPVAIAFSPDGRQLAYSEDEKIGGIALWDIPSRSLTGRLNHQGFVIALAFSQDGQTLASGGRDRTARLWDLAERRERLIFTNDSGDVRSLAFSPNSQTLAIGGWGGVDRMIRLVDVDTGLQTAGLRGHRLTVESLAFTTNGQTLLSASADGTIRVWDTTPRPQEKLAHLFDSISTAWQYYRSAVCLSSDGRHLLSVYVNETFGLWDTLRFEEGERHSLPFTNTTFGTVAPGGKMAAFGSARGEVVLWHAETSQTEFFARADTNPIRRLVFSHDGQFMAATDNHTIRVWNVAAKKEAYVYSTEGERLTSLTFSTDDKVLMAGFFKGPVKLWRLDRPGKTDTFLGQDGEVWGLALSPDGQTLICSTADICFWDIQTRLETYKTTTRGGLVKCISLSADGRRLAAAMADGLIIIYDVTSHEEVARLGRKDPFVRDLAFTPDGDHLVSVSRTELHVWHAPSFAETDAQR
ncbi:MAG TPA: WD40 repeat domain-containing protein, partial [Blastocatellia bacterium]|nr:WD40 repeat domain-containing protein [Blastocatellia bacterium]